MYPRLKAAGKEHKVALLACARKLVLRAGHPGSRRACFEFGKYQSCIALNSLRSVSLFDRRGPFLRPDLPSAVRRAQPPSRMTVVCHESIAKMRSDESCPVTRTRFRRCITIPLVSPVQEVKVEPSKQSPAPARAEITPVRLVAIAVRSPDGHQSR